MNARTAFTCVGFLLVAGCAQRAPAPSQARLPAPVATLPDASDVRTLAISDGANQGNPHFYILSPLPTGATALTPSGTFDLNAQPKVTICELSGSTESAPQLTTSPRTCVRSLNAPAISIGNPYRLRWNTGAREVTADKQYRLSFTGYSDNVMLGFVDVDVSPKGKRSRRNTTAYINLEKGSTLDLKFRVEVGAGDGIHVTPGTLAYGIVKTGASAVQAVSVRNISGAPLQLTPSIDGAPSFTVLKGQTGDCISTPDATSATLAPGATCRIRAQFAPTTPDAQTATLNIASNAKVSLKQVALSGTGTSDAPINDPPLVPRSVVVFPARDFVSAEGYPQGSPVTVEVRRVVPVIEDGQEVLKEVAIASASNVMPVDDTSTPGFDGIVEVNHAGEPCWSPFTRDIRAGDIIHVIQNAGSANQTIDRTTTANVTITQPATQTGPGTVQIKGVASTPSGEPITLGQLEARLISGSDNRFELSGERTLRAPSDGTLTYDSPGATAWTATFSGLSDADVQRALASESRVMWLGRTPGDGNELTIYEVGKDVTGGPQAPCSGTYEGVALKASSGSVTFTTAGVKPVTVTNTGATSTSIDTATLSGPHAAEFLVSSTPCAVAANNGTCTLSVEFKPDPLTIGTRSALLTLAYKDATGNPQWLTVTLSASNLSLAEIGETNNPPANGHSIGVFPSRDFISAEGYPEGDVVTVEVLRTVTTRDADGLERQEQFVVATASDVRPVDDPGTTGFDGIVEVNHAGEACWQVHVNPSFNPGNVIIMAGDVIRITPSLPTAGSTLRHPDATYVAPLTINPPAFVANADGTTTVTLTGTAQPVNGTPITLSQLEARFVSSSKAKFSNDERTLRAPEDGTMAFDGTTWTATFPNLRATDVDIIQREATTSRIMWLGRNTNLGNELTIVEQGGDVAKGPVAECP